MLCKRSDNSREGFDAYWRVELHSSLITMLESVRLLIVRNACWIECGILCFFFVFSNSHLKGGSQQENVKSKLFMGQPRIYTMSEPESLMQISVLMKVRAFASPDVGFADIKWQLAILDEVQFLSLGLHQNETAPTDEWGLLPFFPAPFWLFRNSLAI